MLYVLALVLGIIVGIIAGGKLSNMLNLRFEKAWIIILAFALQVTAQILSLKGVDFTSRYSFIITGLVYILLFAGFWFNKQYLGICILASGSLLNALVMMVNNGKMPVSIKVAEAMGMSSEALRDGKHFIDSAGTARLGFLADTIHLPAYIGFTMRAVSIGDLIIVAGLFLIIFEVITNKRLISKAKRS